MILKGKIEYEIHLEQDTYKINFVNLKDAEAIQDSLACVYMTRIIADNSIHQMQETKLNNREKFKKEFKRILPDAKRTAYELSIIESGIVGDLMEDTILKQQIIKEAVEQAKQSEAVVTKQNEVTEE